MKHLWRMRRRARRSLRRSWREIREASRAHQNVTMAIMIVFLIAGICDLVNMVI